VTSPDIGELHYVLEYITDTGTSWVTEGISKDRREIIEEYVEKKGQDDRTYRVVQRKELHREQSDRFDKSAREKHGEIA